MRIIGNRWGFDRFPLALASGTSSESRRVLSPPTRVSFSRLLQCRGNGAQIVVHRRRNAAESRDKHQTDTADDYPVLDGRRAGFVRDETEDEVAHICPFRVEARGRRVILAFTSPQGPILWNVFQAARLVFCKQNRGVFAETPETAR